MKRREILVALGATTLVAALAGPGLAQERQVMGATFSSSSYYTYQVGIANYLNSTVEGLDLSVQELGGGEVSTQALLRGEIDMGIATTSSDYAAVNGEAPFEGASDTLRTLYFFAPTPINFVVDAASNVQSALLQTWGTAARRHPVGGLGSIGEMLIEHNHGFGQGRGSNSECSFNQAHLPHDTWLQAPCLGLSFA